MIAMSRDEFWTYIEQCRQHSDSMPTFNQLLEEMLDTWELPALAAFHKVMWDDLGVDNDKTLWEVVSTLIGKCSDDCWECYGGWLIAQGRAFHEAVRRDPKAAAHRVPLWEDIFQGEVVIFAAQRICYKKTGNKWNLHDLFGYDLDGKREPYVDYPVTW